MHIKIKPEACTSYEDR